MEGPLLDEEMRGEGNETQNNRFKRWRERPCLSYELGTWLSEEDQHERKDR